MNKINKIFIISITMAFTTLIICICATLYTVKAMQYKNNNNVNKNNVEQNKQDKIENNFFITKGTVVSLNTIEDVVTVLDMDGQAFEFYGTEDWMVKDGCVMLINNKGTKNRRDDVIVDILYDAR